MLILLSVVITTRKLKKNVVDIAVWQSTCTHTPGYETHSSYLTCVLSKLSTRI